jgi:CheY-like chemotaxis protein
MGGTILVESEKGVGSTFSFELTFEKCEDQYVVDSIEHSGHYDALKSIRILVVEDDAMNQMLISAILEKNDIMYDFAFNGQEALNKLKEYSFDLVLMDIQMSVMDGISTTEYIRKKMQSTIPIIALTANASKEDERIYLDAGMDGHISKPFKKAELFSKMIELMGKPMSSIKRSEHSENNPWNSLNISYDQLYSLSGLIEMASGDLNFVQSIVDTFRTNTPNYLNKIAEGITTLDIEKIRHNAHQLKPSVDFFKVESIRQTVRDIEEACKNEDTNMEMVKANFVMVKEVLEAVIKDLYSKY